MIMEESKLLAHKHI